MEPEIALDVIENADTWGTTNAYSSFRQSTIDIKLDDQHCHSLQSTQTKQRCISNIIIHPFGPFRYSLDALITIVLIYTTIEVPIIIAFNMDMSLSEPAGILALCCDILLFIDLLINFRVAYFDRFDRLLLITNTYNIAIKYLRTWFIIDCLSCIPIEFFIGNTNNYNIIINSLCFAKLLRLVKMMHILNGLSKQFMTREAKVFFKLFRLISFMLLFAHFCACIWWYIGNTHIHETTWIDMHDLRSEDISIFEKYTYSFYWAVVTLFTTGYGDITATNTTEMWICSVCILIGTMFFSYFIGTLTMLITEGDKVKSYRLSKMEEAQHFCDIKRLPKELTRAVLTHTSYHCRYNFVFDEDEFIRTLPPYLQLDILSKISNNKIMLKNIKAFKSLKDEILGKISLKIRAVSCNKNKILFHKGSRAKCIYIQRTGTAILDFHDMRKITLQRGTVFGISALISPKRKATVNCKTWCEFYCLPVVDIVNILQTEYPETWRARWVKITDAIRNTGDIERLDKIHLGTTTSKTPFRDAPNGLSEFLHSGNTTNVHRYSNSMDKIPKPEPTTAKRHNSIKKKTKIKNPFVLKSRSSTRRNETLKAEYQTNIINQQCGDELKTMIAHKTPVQKLHSNGGHTEFYMNNGSNDDDESDNVGDIAAGLSMIDHKFTPKYRPKLRTHHQSKVKRIGKMGGIRKTMKLHQPTPPTPEHVSRTPTIYENTIAPAIEMEILDALDPNKKHDENHLSESYAFANRNQDVFAAFQIIDDENNISTDHTTPNDSEIESFC